jgi:hypothetical protein
MSSIKERYCFQKCRDLQKFGYSTLTLTEVQEQYDKVEAGSSDLSVIGMFIKRDFQDAGIWRPAEVNNEA